MSDFLANLARRAAGLAPTVSKPVPARPAGLDQPDHWSEVPRLDPEEYEAKGKPLAPQSTAEPEVRPEGGRPEMPPLTKSALERSPRPQTSEPQEIAEGSPELAQKADSPRKDHPTSAAHQVSVLPAEVQLSAASKIRPPPPQTAGVESEHSPAVLSPRPDNEQQAPRPDNEQQAAPLQRDATKHRLEPEPLVQTRIVPRPPAEPPRIPQQDRDPANINSEQQQRVEVRIGRIDIEVAQSPPVPATPARRERPRGFDDYARLRSYLER